MTRLDRRTIRGGFTLVELLVVIAVIVVLVALSLGVGALVTRGGNARATQSLLQSLDRAVQEYVGVNGTIPPYIPEQYIGVPGEDSELTSYQGEMHHRRPDTSVFIAQARGVGVAGEIIDNLPARFRFARSGRASLGPAANTGQTAPSIVDSWADESWSQPYRISDQQLVYYVHPDNFLAQDLYGRCVNNTPYFLSAGPDELYGISDDPFVPDPASGESVSAGVHTHASVLEAQRDNLTSYPLEPITLRAFERTQSAGVR